MLLEVREGPMRASSCRPWKLLTCQTFLLGSAETECMEKRLFALWCIQFPVIADYTTNEQRNLSGRNQMPLERRRFREACTLRTRFARRIVGRHDVEQRRQQAREVFRELS